ncbi:MAG: FlgD immunoglobulin-like domain containing protein [bacterium]
MLLTAVVVSYGLLISASRAQEWGSLSEADRAAFESGLRGYAGPVLPLRARCELPVELNPPSLRASWSGEFGPPPGGQGMSSSVNALAPYAGGLAVGGDFTSAGAQAVNHVTLWNGASWSALGHGLEDRVFALATFQGSLVAGGSFQYTAHHVAIWDGSRWAALGTGLPSDVFALAVFNGKLFAGGFFGLQQWDGSRWSDVGPGIDPGGIVAALAVHSGALVVGGAFRSAGGIPTDTPNIAQWTGSAWQPVGKGAGSFVTSLASRGDSLFVGGGFQTVRQPNNIENGAIVSSPYVAMWRSSSASWDSTFVANMHPNASVWCITPFGSTVAFGGEFSAITQGPSAAHIATWDGVTWAALGTGTSGATFAPNVRCLAALGGDLYAGGWFTQAGLTASEFFGRWQQAPLPVIGAPWVSAFARGHALRIAPNPSRGGVSFALAADDARAVSFSIFDVAGRLVHTTTAAKDPVGRFSASWDGRLDAGYSAPPGVYFARATRDGLPEPAGSFVISR